ncbi:Side tail fiber protein from lambdoid prophage Rac [Megasphaera elsdenii]|uniref:Side tail fiber protein from lambdoid prophage Rac n=2 Tax=Megasphaera elsdenii TaxID=907 RepID=G0VSB0_MEGEL|nr:side tail fiber protein from lambdoid prophage Rac [Megasphaera elsdenii DSM 20460]
MVAAQDSERKASVSEINTKSSEQASKLSETNARKSEESAASSAATATGQASSARTSASNASVSEANSKASEKAASVSASNAKASADTASTQASASASSATSAKNSATSASQSASSASSSASSASNSASSAASSAASASDSKDKASEYKTSASGSATAAASSASSASTSATNAKAAMNTANTAASSASTSATSASTSASNASKSEVAAKSAQAEAEKARDEANSALAKISGALKYMGQVDNYNDLPSTGNSKGDTWNVVNADLSHHIKAGDNVAWNGTEWDDLSGVVDLSAYAEKTDYQKAITSATANGATITFNHKDGTTSTATVNNVASATAATNDAKGQKIDTTYEKISDASNVHASLQNSINTKLDKTGTAVSATKLSTARTIQINLASTTATAFDGSANITPGVTGTLSVSNGGTGSNSLANIIVGRATSDDHGNNIANTYLKKASALGKNNLNTITAEGIYYQNGNDASNVTDSNYPCNRAGSLIVTTNYADGDSGCSQIYIPYDNNTIYIRHHMARSGIWSSWSNLATTDSNVNSANKLATARTISLTGNATGSASFDGSGDISISTTVNESKHAAAADIAKTLQLVEGDRSTSQATFNWIGKDGQPAWLWGGNGMNNMYVYNPSNFYVARAKSADTATKANQDASGNVITDTYAKKTYVDERIAALEDAVNTLKKGATTTNG